MVKDLSIRQAFGETLTKLARHDRSIYVVNADLKSSLSLNKFAKLFPSRFIECGVAEANAAGVAAGLAKTGKKVFLTSFSCFSPSINWNTIKQSICYNHANVTIVGSHSGLFSTDLGATHQMLEDVALMRSLPNMQVFAPLDAIETEKIVSVIARSPLPSYLRLIRPHTPSIYNPKNSFTIGKSYVLKRGHSVTVLGYGPTLIQAFNIGSTSVEIINCSSIKPLDSETILKSVEKTGRLIVLEDHQKNGGLGEAVASLVLSAGLSPKFIHLAVDNRFGQSAKDFRELYKHYGIGVDYLREAVNVIMSSR
ncbi:MAG: transketolase C-terminal domain-containing protein [Candidatus Shapirobacteria bacterium]|jgi:transketolase